MKQRIKRARVSFLSLVPRGANQLPGLYKSEDDNMEFASLVKANEDFDEKGQLTALVYAPDREDSQKHFADSSTIRDMAYSFMEEGARLDIKHDRRELEKAQAFVAESFIVQDGDPRFQGMTDYLGKEVTPTGGWGVVLQINDESLRKAYREGGWNGVSLFSYAGDYELEGSVEKALEEFQQRKEGKFMDESKLAELLKESNKILVETLLTALKPVEEAAPEAQEQEMALEYKGSPDDIEALEKHHKEVQFASLKKGVDFSNPEEVEKYIEAVKAIKGEDLGKQEEEVESDESQQLRKQMSDLQAKLDRSLGKSRVPDIAKSQDQSNYFGLSREESELFDIGCEIGDIANSQRGYDKE
jgi:hypothetical protein